MSSYALDQTLPTGSILEEGLLMHSAYLELSVLEAVNLGKCMEYYESLNPYVFISQKNREWASKLGMEQDPGTFVWGEVFELDVDRSKSFKIQLLDKDEYGSDTVIGGLLVSPEMLFREEQQEHWLKLEIGSEETPLRSSGFLGSPLNKEPMLHISAKLVDPSASFSYSVQFVNHRNFAYKTDPHTMYEVRVFKGDGSEWTVYLRYSEVFQVKKEVTVVMPHLRSAKFPAKTYFDWLSLFSKKLSKFYAARIQERKGQMQEFLNLVLKDFSTLKSERLQNLLKII